MGKVVHAFPVADERSCWSPLFFHRANEHVVAIDLEDGAGARRFKLRCYSIQTGRKVVDIDVLAEATASHIDVDHWMKKLYGAVAYDTKHDRIRIFKKTYGDYVIHCSGDLSFDLGGLL